LSKSSNSTSAGTTTTPVLIGACIAWGVMTLLFFLLFTAPDAEGNQPSWFLVGINLLEIGAFFLASVLCFRNWRSSQIVSGRNVWFWIGLGLLSYSFGNILFFIWGTIWGLDPSVSLGDFFYILSYVFLAAGMFKAVLPRRLNLELSQWLVVAGIGLAGILLAIFVNLAAAEATPIPDSPPAIAQIAQAPPLAEPAPENAPENAPEPVAVPEPVAETSSAPGWVAQFDQILEPLADGVGLLYLIGDIVLLIIAGTLLVAFWGGRYSQSWKLIAIAAICLYIADMFFAYAVNTGTYQEGSLWEVFWTFSAVFFGLGAVVEYAISTNARRSTRRRR
jgi:FtsH-binding integral membrane protein